MLMADGTARIMPLEEFKAAKVRLPIDYLWFGRSFDGIDYRFLSILKQRAPADYKRVLQWFPMAEVEIMRRLYGVTAK